MTSLNVGKKYLIVGGAGFIGSHLAAGLLAHGGQVVVVDARPVSRPQLNITAYVADVENSQTIADIFLKEKPDVLIHLAGPMNLRRSADDPLFLRDQHFLKRTEIIATAAKNAGVKKILFVSSGGALYEDARQFPTPETYPIHPQSPYGQANAAIETYLTDFCARHSMQCVIARLSNAYGPGQWERGFVVAMIRGALKNQPPVIYGTGQQTRDFIYIDDVVSALEVLLQKAGSGVYNVASGREITLRQVLDQICQLLGTGLAPVHQDARQSEIQRSVLDISKIRNELGWEPAVAISEGLQKTIEYYRNEKS